MGWRADLQWIDASPIKRNPCTLALQCLSGVGTVSSQGAGQVRRPTRKGNFAKRTQLTTVKSVTYVFRSECQTVRGDEWIRASNWALQGRPLLQRVQEMLIQH